MSLCMVAILCAGCAATRPTARATAEFKRQLAVAPSGKEQGLERDLVQRTNAVRRRHGLKPLQPQNRYHRVARAHSRDMRDADYVGHTSPTTGGPADRLEAAGLAFMAAKENVAKGYSPKGVIEGLMQSPGHRANMLSAEVTHLGLGVAVDASSSPPALLVTQLFVTPGKAYKPATARRDVLAILQRCRRAAGRRPFKVDGALDGVAAQAMRDQPDNPASAMARGMGELSSKFRSLQSSVVQTSVLDGLGQTAICRMDATHIGLAVAKTGAMITVAVVLGTRR